MPGRALKIENWKLETAFWYFHQLMPNKGISLSVKGRVALVSGGSRGIGAATVRLLVAAGGKAVFNYQKAREAAERMVKQCGQANCHAVQADLSTSQAAGALVQAAVKRFGRLDILVANHGIWPPQDVAVDRMSERQWRESMAINLDSVFGLVKHAVAQMKKQGATITGTGEPRIGAHGKPVVFLHPKDFVGTLVELEQA